MLKCAPTMAYLNYTAQDFASNLENRRPLVFKSNFIHESWIKLRIMWSLYHRYLRNLDVRTIIFHKFCLFFLCFFFLNFKKWKLNMINRYSFEDALPNTEDTHQKQSSNSTKFSTNLSGAHGLNFWTVTSRAWKVYPTATSILIMSI